MKKTFAAALLLALVFLGAGCTGSQPVQMDPVTLEYWRPDDEPADMAELIAAYQKIHPQIQINYTKVGAERYLDLVLEALAEDRGPDLFVLPNVSLKEWQDKILPLPKETSVVTMEVNQQKQIVPVKKKTPSLTIRELNNTYVEAVAKDVIMIGPSEKRGGRRRTGSTACRFRSIPWRFTTTRTC